jgi:hypothetical protein
MRVPAQASPAISFVPGVRRSAVRHADLENVDQP